MSIISVGGLPVRRLPEEVLGIEGGPSRRGSTYWSRFLHCEFEHYLSNVLSWGAEQMTEPLTTGIVWHHGLERYYLDRQAWQESALAQDPNLDKRDPHFLCGNSGGPAAFYEAIQPFSSEPGYEEIYETIARMAEAYIAKWRFESFEILAVEDTMEVSSPLEYSSRLDLIVVDWATRIPATRIIEHKSTYRMDHYVLEGYTQDLQTLGQVYVFEKFVDLEKYPPFIGSLVNVTSKTKNPECERIHVQPSPEALNVWERAMLAHARRSEQAEKETDHHYAKNYAACTRRYGRCEFFDLCRSFPSVDETMARSMTTAGELPPGYKVRLNVWKEDAR